MNGVETSVQIFQFLWTRSNISAKIAESRIRALFKVPHGFVPGGPQELRDKRSRRKQQRPHQLTKALAATVCFLTQRIWLLHANANHHQHYSPPQQNQQSTMSNSRKSNYPKTFLQKMFLQVSCMTLNKLYSFPASISLPVEWQQQNCFPRQPPGLKEVMYEKVPCSNARRTLGTKQKLISMLWKCWLESMPLKTSAMWKISISAWISKQRKLDDGSRLTLAQMKPSVRMQRVTELYGAPSSGRRAGHRGAK